MNIDLTKGTLANVLLVGSGVLLAILVLFCPPGLSLFEHFGGYFLSVLLGFVLLPFLRIRENVVYNQQTYDVIRGAQKIIGSICDAERSGRAARPAYDLFLREIPHGDRLIERLHDLGGQVRFMFALGRFPQILALLVAVAVVAKFSLSLRDAESGRNVLSFLPDHVAWYVAFAVVICAVALYVARVIINRGVGILTRQRDMERMAVFVHSDFFQSVGSRIKEDADRFDSLSRQVEC